MALKLQGHVKHKFMMPQTYVSKKSNLIFAAQVVAFESQCSGKP
jgi:hypothetical protein